MDQQWSRHEFHFVGSDDRPGVLAAVDHLVALGHRSIGCLHFPRVSTGRVRQEAFVEGMSRHGLHVREEWLVPAATYEQGLESAHHLLTLPNRPTAIVCYTDLVAWAALNVATELGLRVPDDLSLVGFADLPLAQRLRPQLTTVVQAKEQLGIRAVGLLFERMAAGEDRGLPFEPRTVLLPTELIERESTGRISG